MATAAHLTRYASQDVTLLGDARRPGGVTLAFTERTGGVSKAPFTSLNLGADCGDSERDVLANRRLVLDALGVGELAGRLVNPLQVHGTTVVTIDSAAPDDVASARRLAREGADAIVCTAADVPVLLCYADCVPVILAATGGFAVVHSGWRGTIGRISQKATEELCRETGCEPSELVAHIGPHIGRDDYEVSADLAERFVASFGQEVAPDGRHLDLGLAVRKTLIESGINSEAIGDELPSTASCTDRFYSYRAEGGKCGRHGAIAVLHA